MALFYDGLCNEDGFGVVIEPMLFGDLGEEDAALPEMVKKERVEGRRAVSVSSGDSVVYPGQFRQQNKKRKRSYWTETELQALLKGVSRHGKGNWTNIKNDKDLAPLLVNRSTVDIKDKWRNYSSVTRRSHKNARKQQMKQQQLQQQPETIISPPAALPLIPLPHHHHQQQQQQQQQEQYPLPTFEDGDDNRMLMKLPSEETVAFVDVSKSFPDFKAFTLQFVPYNPYKPCSVQPFTMVVESPVMTIGDVNTKIFGRYKHLRKCKLFLEPFDCEEIFEGPTNGSGLEHETLICDLTMSQNTLYFDMV